MFGLNSQLHISTNFSQNHGPHHWCCLLLLPTSHYFSMEAHLLLYFSQKNAQETHNQIPHRRRRRRRRTQSKKNRSQKIELQPTCLTISRSACLTIRPALSPTSFRESHVAGKASNHRESSVRFGSALSLSEKRELWVKEKKKNEEGEVTEKNGLERDVT